MHPLLKSELQPFVDPRHIGLANRASELLEHSLSERGRKSAEDTFKRFKKWCEQRDLCALPASPATLAEYIAYLSVVRGCGASSIMTALSSVGRTHRNAALADPREDRLLRELLKPLQRKYRQVPSPFRPLPVAELRKVISSIPKDPRGLRDRALLLLCYAGALRPNLAVAIDIEQIEMEQESLTIDNPLLRYPPLVICAATDPVLCPLAAVREWLAACGHTRGPLFYCMRRRHYACRSRLKPNWAGKLFQLRARKAGLGTQAYSAISLRRGAIVSAAARGATRVPLMILGNFKLPRSLDPYIQIAARWQTTDRAAPRTLRAQSSASELSRLDSRGGQKRER